MTTYQVGDVIETSDWLEGQNGLYVITGITENGEYIVAHPFIPKGNGIRSFTGGHNELVYHLEDISSFLSEQS